MKKRRWRDLKGHEEQSDERNSPVGCFGARVRRRKAARSSLLLRQRKAHRKVCFALADQKRFERECPREGRARPLAVRGGGSARSEQIRSIGSAPRERDRDDYICEVQRREAARSSLLLRPKKKDVALRQRLSFLLKKYIVQCFKNLRLRQ